MQPTVTFRLADETTALLGPGDIIGRSLQAALCLNEPYISEGHAMISLRSGQLALLALRGRVSVDGRRVAQLALRQGQRILLAGRLPLFVETVDVPDHVLGLRGGGLASPILPSVCSLTVNPKPELSIGFNAEADAYFWDTGVMNMRIGDGAAAQVTVGQRVTVGDYTFTLTALPIGLASRVPTEDSEEVGGPLHLILKYATVHIIAGPRRVLLTGNSARIICELASTKVPMKWQEIGRELWPHDFEDSKVMRERWDSCVARLRRKLKVARIRPDVLRATGQGLIELMLTQADTVEDLM
jgi:hypothetical protein